MRPRHRRVVVSRLAAGPIVRTDARHSEVCVIGEQWSPRCQEARDLLGRHGTPFGFYPSETSVEGDGGRRRQRRGPVAIVRSAGGLVRRGGQAAEPSRHSRPDHRRGGGRVGRQCRPSRRHLGCRGGRRGAGGPRRRRLRWPPTARPGWTSSSPPTSTSTTPETARPCGPHWSRLWPPGMVKWRGRPTAARFWRDK